jgi:hypothetical protein
MTDHWVASVYEVIDISTEIFETVILFEDSSVSNNYIIINCYYLIIIKSSRATAT